MYAYFEVRSPHGLAAPSMWAWAGLRQEILLLPPSAHPCLLALAHTAPALPRPPDYSGNGVEVSIHLGRAEIQVTPYKNTELIWARNGIAMARQGLIILSQNEACSVEQFPTNSEGLCSDGLAVPCKGLGHGRSFVHGRSSRRRRAPTPACSPSTGVEGRGRV